MNPSPVYNLLGIEITLRCDHFCKNCKIFCNSKEKTGLDYSDLDMTLLQIEKFVQQVETLGKKLNRVIIQEVVITGGECTLHPQLEEITLLIKNRLLDKYINVLKILTNDLNNTVKYPQIADLFFNWVPKERKSEEHWAVTIHPKDSNQKAPSFYSCRHFKNDIILSAHGYNICCSSEGLIRLFGKDYLFLAELPERLEDFPIAQMDQEICCHCCIGCQKVFYEKDVGAPISEIYLEEGKLNKKGRKIQKRF